MQFLVQVYYFLRSLTLRGPYHTYRLAMGEHGKDKLFNVSTAAFKKSESTDYFHYQGAAYQVLDRVFAELVKMAPGYSFTDIGAGKGRVLFFAEQFGYTDITGIELDAESVQLAQKNIQLYKYNSKDSQIRILQKNALEYSYPDRHEVYFMFNPFSGQVLGKVLERILEHNKHEKYFVYMNPLYRSEFEKRSFTEIKRIKSFLYTEAIIYKATDQAIS